MPLEKSQFSTSTRASYYVSNLFFRAVIGGLRMLPYGLRIATMGRIASTLSPMVGFTKRVRDNLRIACPDLPEDTVKWLCRAVPDNAGRAMMEQFSPEEFVARQSSSPIRGPGLAAFEQARSEGRPILMITAHFGNYLAARAALQARGAQIGGLYRRMANPYFNDIYVDAFKRTGEPMFEQGRRGMRQMVHHLKGGGIIAIVSDLHVHGGEELTFFGQPAVTSVLNAELALKYNAAVIPVYSVRQPNGLDFEVVMNAPIPHSDPITMTQALNDDLEALVRDHMDQWFWIHRRWKPWFNRGLQPEVEDKQD